MPIPKDEASWYWLRMLSPLSFASIPEYIEACRRPKKGLRKRNLTLGEVAARLGYRSPRTVAMVLKGQRKPSLELVERISSWQKLTIREREYLVLLAQIQGKRSKADVKGSLSRKIEELRDTVAKTTLLPDEIFTYVSAWYHLPIRQLIEAPDFCEDPTWISKKLKNKLTAAEANEALQRLLDLGLATRDPQSGRLRRSQPETAWTSQDIPSRAIQSYHLAMLQRAMDAIQEDLVSNREINSSCMRVAPERMDEVKDFIRKFHTEFASRFADPNGAEVFQLNSQFFKHTR